MAVVLLFVYAGFFAGVNAWAMPAQRRDSATRVGLVDLATGTIAARPPGYSLAVVMPFVDAQQTRLLASAILWSQPDRRPCAARSAPLAASIYLYHPQVESTLNVSAFGVALGDAAECFGGGVTLVGASLSDDDARYPDGTCFQFYALFALLRGRADYFYLMEPDALPIRLPRYQRLQLAKRVAGVSLNAMRT